MATDRAAALRNAEKLVRQGKLDEAIAAYLRVVEEQPRDWNTANTLGDLYIRAAASDKAIQQFTRIADGLREDGFLPKAAALYKKILKITPDDEHAQLQAAEIAAAQGVLVDARSYMNAVAERRRQRGDSRGAAAIVLRLGSLDRWDWDARRLAARAMVELGDAPAAVSALKTLAADLAAKAQEDLGVEVLEEAAGLDPNDGELRVQLFKALAQKGDMASATRYLSADTDVQDAPLLLSVVEVDLRAGRVEEALALVDRVLALGPAERPAIVTLAAAVGEDDAAAGHVMAVHVVDRLVAEQDWRGAAAVLETFLSRVPHHVPALSRLVEVSVDGGLDDVMIRAQGQLAEAHLAGGLAREARFIAEDLLIRNPGDAGHVDRLRRVLRAMGEEDPDRIIADCVSARESLVESGDRVSDRPAPVASSIPEGPAVQNRAPVERPVALPPVPDHARPAPIAQAQHRSQNIEVDLSVVLDQMRKPAEVASEPTDLDDVFAQMRNQARKRLAVEATEDEFRKGLALFKAGQVHDSIPALEAASHNPRFRFESAATLGRIFLGRGDLRKAVEWFERAADSPAATPEEGHVVLYDLADALESLGETTRALALYLELQADAGIFRDVKSRIDRLAKAQARG